MKTKAFFLGTAILFAIISISITGCGDSGQQNKEETVEHAGEHEHHEEKTGAGDGHEDAEHSHAKGGHMQHMVDVRKWLKEELKDQYDQPVPPSSEEQLARGKEIYAKTCVACHGESGKGDGPASAILEQKPADFTDSAHSKYYSDQGRIYIIKKGVKGTPMEGWESALNEKEIQSVYAYVASLRSSENEEEHEHAEGKYACPMHPEITSDEPGKCSKCGMNLKLKEERHNHGGHEH